MARTGENIYTRKDGRFEGRFIAARDENGKAVYKAVYGSSKAEVREKMEAAKRELLGDPSPFAEKSFREVAESWLESIPGKVAATTYDRYSDALMRDIYPEYADTPMRDVTEAEMNRFIQRVPELARKRGRELKNSTLQLVRAVMSNVIAYAKEAGGDEKADLSCEVNSYAPLSHEEIEKLCIRAKYMHSPEMLAALLALYCGMRIGEICALHAADVDMGRREIYIHRIAHRVKNPDKGSTKKTAVVVEELPRKTQIRRVSFPAAMEDYIREQLLPGRVLIRVREGDNSPVDPRTMEGRLERALEKCKMGSISFERLRKTWLKGKADEQLLSDVFLGVQPDAPYAGALDIRWLTDEMARDLAPLRLLVGLSAEEMGVILGISEGMYRALENGSRDISWDQYLSILFVFYYNGRTIEIVDKLGLFPGSLKERLKIGG